MQLDVANHAPASHFLRKADAQLNEYFAGEQSNFGLERDSDGTPFEKLAWSVLTPFLQRG